MTGIYIVVQVGYEGIESINRGFMTPDGAVTYYNQLLKEIEAELTARWREDDFLPEEQTADELKERIKGRQSRVCIRRGSETEEFKCVCKELGVGPDELILY